MRSSGRNATLKEKRIIAAERLEPNNWYVVKHTSSILLIRHKTTKTKRELKVSQVIN